MAGAQRVHSSRDHDRIGSTAPGAAAEPEPTESRTMSVPTLPLSPQRLTPDPPAVRRAVVSRRLGRRTVVVDAEVPLAGRGGGVRVVVLRHGRELAAGAWPDAGPGRHRLRLALARGTTAGYAWVHLDLLDPTAAAGVGTAVPVRVFVPAR